MAHKIVFVRSGRGQAQCEADPRFPVGIEADGRTGPGPSCLIEFPYPAKECGHWRTQCDVCGYSLAVTAAGRAERLPGLRGKYPWTMYKCKIGY